MPLDMGGVTVLHPVEGGEAHAPQMPTLDHGPHVGAALRAVREARGLTLQAIADMTRVRPVYLAAIEEMSLDDLPSRPFVVGYLRAYAKALGLDDEAAVARFRAENSEAAEPLRAPSGVQKQRDPRLALAAVVGVLIIVAIAAWNVSRRAMTEEERHPATTAEPATPVAPAKAAPQVSLGEPLPAPTESTLPTPYVTPGMADAAAADGSVAAAVAAAKARAAAGVVIQAAAGPPPPPTFRADGTIYGTAGPGPSVLMQARKSASLVVSDAAGKVHFARQLAAGEAYRVPVGGNLQADVSDATAFAIYTNGTLSAAALPAAKTSLAKLIPAMPPPAPAGPPAATATVAPEAATAPPAAQAGSPAPRPAQPRPAAPTPAPVAALAPIGAAPAAAAAAPAPEAP
jgi:cytoskeletal protein RodZ